MGTGVRELGLQGGGKGGNLGRGGCLVLVHEEFELATGTLGGGEAGVRDADNALEVGRHTTVDAELIGLEGDDLASGDSDLANEAGLDFLGESSHTSKLGGEVLAELLHLGGSLGASGTEILHGLGEPRISEGSLLSERVVEASDGSTKLLRSIAAVLSELDVSSTELSSGGLLGLGELGGEELTGGSGAGLVLGGETLNVGSRLLDVLGNLLLHSGSLGLDLSGDLLGVGLHLAGVGIDSGVRLLDG